MRELAVSGLQLRLSDNEEENIRRAVSKIRERGCSNQVVLLSELFQGYYFCGEQSELNFKRARSVQESPSVRVFRDVTRELGLVMPICFFEVDGTQFYNSVAILDRGEVLGVYRKSHIPDGTGYQEKYYFRPGNTGFRVWETSLGRVGVGICWDQWFPEVARALTLAGADVLLYPTAIGSEPTNPDPLCTKDRWQKAMIGHAVCNVVPVMAVNRVGEENGRTFYGHSFAADCNGTVLEERTDAEEGWLEMRWNPEQVKVQRASWGFFRDRRVDLYRGLVE